MGTNDYSRKLHPLEQFFTGTEYYTTLAPRWSLVSPKVIFHNSVTDGVLVNVAKYFQGKLLKEGRFVDKSC